jgi:hypothetical protein
MLCCVLGRALVFRADANVSTETITGGERYNMVVYCDVSEQPADVDTTDATAPARSEHSVGLLGLPEPVKHRIMGHLSLNDLNALALTSDACFKLVTYQSLPVWERLCHEKQYPHAQVLFIY